MRHSLARAAWATGGVLLLVGRSQTPWAAEPAPATRRSTEDVIDELGEDAAEKRRLKERQARALVEQAKVAHRAGRFVQALELARRAARLDPRLKAAQDLAAALREYAGKTRPRVSERLLRMVLYAGLVRARERYLDGDLQGAVDWFAAVIRGANRLPRDEYADACVDYASLALALANRRLKRFRGKPGEAGSKLKPAKGDLDPLPDPPPGSRRPTHAAPGKPTGRTTSSGSALDLSKPVTIRGLPPAKLPAAARKKGEITVRFPAWYRELKRRLARRISVDFTNTPLKDVVDHVRRETEANIVYDARRLGASDAEAPRVTLKTDDTAAETVLWLAVRMASCGAVFRHESLVVTSSRMARAWGNDPGLPPVDLRFRTPPERPTPARGPWLRDIQARVDALREADAFVRFCENPAGTTSRRGQP